PSGKKSPGAAQLLVDRFLGNELASRPLGFYSWDEELGTLHRARRFLAADFAARDLTVPNALAESLKGDPTLLADYRKLAGVLGKLGTPAAWCPLDKLPLELPPANPLGAAPGATGIGRGKAVSFLPPSTSRERELVGRLSPRREVDLIRELVRRIRSGEVDLAPRKGCGWRDHQVWALEALLLPGRGQEEGKLIFSARYKQRLLESFKAVVTRRRETHLRRARPPVAPGVPGPAEEVAPRLRVEPAPTWYLRTARSYDFVRRLLTSVLGGELEDMYGRRETWTYGQIRERKLAERDDDLATELAFMRRLFYGLYLVSCEDVGLRPAFAEGEEVDVETCRQAALNWIESFRRDPDLKPDARVCVPAHVHADGSVTFWSTIGVRLARLEAAYARPPSVRAPGGPWQVVPEEALIESDYLIPVDAFASFSLAGSVLSRKEFWDLLGMAGTRDAFVDLTAEMKTRAALLKALEEHRRKEAEEAEE
ncbi:MAG: hypothetical protein ACYTGB_09845, partial [Planctomycetota bacterium]